MVFLTVNDTGHAMVTRSGNDDTALPALQTLVDGLVDCVTAVIDGVHFDVWVNDEGMFREDFRVNLPLTMLLGRQIVGPAVFATSDAEGRTLGLSERGADVLAATLSGMGCRLCVLEEQVLDADTVQYTAYELHDGFDPEMHDGNIVTFDPEQARMTCAVLSAMSAQDSGGF